MSCFKFKQYIFFHPSFDFLILGYFLNLKPSKPAAWFNLSSKKEFVGHLNCHQKRKINRSSKPRNDTNFCSALSIMNVFYGKDLVRKGSNGVYGNIDSKSSYTTFKGWSKMAKIEVSKYAFRVPSPILVILYK